MHKRTVGVGAGVRVRMVKNDQVALQHHDNVKEKMSAHSEHELMGQKQTAPDVSPLKRCVILLFTQLRIQKFRRPVHIEASFDGL
eukprot:1156878-Pelagomonas_calceolata.AAC.3